jgi:hypothetical protein
VTARVEERHDPLCVGINSGNIRPLVVIAGETGQTKIARSSKTAVLDSDNVVNLKGKPVVGLRDFAVLATVASPLPDQLLERVVHGASVGVALPARVSVLKGAAGFGLQDVEQMSDPLVVGDLSLLNGAESAFTGFGGQLAHSILVSLREVEG